MHVCGLDFVELMLPADEVEQAALKFGALLGCAFSAPQVSPDGAVIYSQCFAGGLEVVAATAQSPVSAFFPKPGELGRAGPIVWRVENLDLMRRKAEEKNLTVATTMEVEGLRTMYLQADQCLGYTVGFAERPNEPFPYPAPATSKVLKLNRIELLQPTEQFEKANAFFGDLLGVEMHNGDDASLSRGIKSNVSWDAQLEIFTASSPDAVRELNKFMAPRGSGGVIGPIVWDVSDMGALKSHAAALGHDIAHELKLPERHQVVLNPEKLSGFLFAFNQNL